MDDAIHLCDSCADKAKDGWKVVAVVGAFAKKECAHCGRKCYGGSYILKKKGVSGC